MLFIRLEIYQNYWKFL